MTSWISVDIDLPEVGVEVIVWSKDLGICVARLDCDFMKSFIDSNGCFVFRVTHWMKSPEPPK